MYDGQYSMIFFLHAHTSATGDYRVTVTTHPPNQEAFLIGRTSITFLCSIEPRPPASVHYVWRTSTPGHEVHPCFTGSPAGSVQLYNNHPRYGRYYCLVYSSSKTDATLLGVGSTIIEARGKTYSCMNNTYIYLWH